MHICTVTIASVQIYTLLHPLVWAVLEENCANFDIFCILQTFATTDVVALKEVYGCSKGGIMAIMLF